MIACVWMIIHINSIHVATCIYVHVHAPAILSVVEPVEPVGSGIECSSDSEHVHVHLE